MNNPLEKVVFIKKSLAFVNKRDAKKYIKLSHTNSEFRETIFDYSTEVLENYSLADLITIDSVDLIPFFLKKDTPINILNLLAENDNKNCILFFFNNHVLDELYITTPNGTNYEYQTNNYERDISLFYLELLFFKDAKESLKLLLKEKKFKPFKTKKDAVAFFERENFIWDYLEIFGVLLPGQTGTVTEIVFEYFNKRFQIFELNRFNFQNIIDKDDLDYYNRVPLVLNLLFSKNTVLNYTKKEKAFFKPLALFLSKVIKNGGEQLQLFKAKNWNNKDEFFQKIFIDLCKTKYANPCSDVFRSLIDKEFLKRYFSQTKIDFKQNFNLLILGFIILGFDFLVPEEKSLLYYFSIHKQVTKHNLDFFIKKSKFNDYGAQDIYGKTMMHYFIENNRIHNAKYLYALYNSHPRGRNILKIECFVEKITPEKLISSYIGNVNFYKSVTKINNRILRKRELKETGLREAREREYFANAFPYQSDDYL